MKMLCSALALVAATPALARPPIGTVPVPPPIFIPAPPPPVAPAPPSTSSPAIVATPAGRARALELMTLLNSEQKARAQFDKLYAVVPAVLRTKPEMAALEERSPGTLIAVANAERSVLEPTALAALPQIRQALADLVSRRMTEADLSTVLDYYRSTGGQRLVSAVVDNFDGRAIVSRNYDHPDSSTNAGDVRAAAAPGLSEFLANSTPAERLALVRFGSSAAGRKWRALQPEIGALTASLGDKTAQSVIEQAQLKILDVIAERSKDRPKQGQQQPSGGNRT